MNVSDITLYLRLYLKSIRYVWRASKANVFLMLITIPIQALLPSVTLYITNLFINELNDLSSYQLIVLLFVWGGAFLLNNICVPLTTMLQEKLTDALTYKLNYDIMKKSESLQTIDYFEDSHFYNDLQLLSSEASWRPVNLLVFGTSIITNLILFVSMLVIFASFHPLIAIVMLLSLIPQGWMTYKIQQQAFETLVSNSEESRKLMYYSQSLLSSSFIKDIRLYNLYDLFLGKYTKVFHQIRDGVQKTRLRKFFLSIFFLILTTILSVASFTYIVWSIAEQQLEIGSIMLFSTSMIYATTSMTRLVEDSSLLYDTLLYMNRFFNFIHLSSERNVEQKRTLPSVIDSIEFKNVSFSYSKADNPALKAVNFKVHQGEKIAIVGENGAGKTTLVKLLCRFYPLQSGEILVNGHSYTEYHPNDYRKSIGAIFQDFAKFDLTLRENVAVSYLEGKTEDSAIKQALHESGFEDEMMTNLDQVLGKQFEGSRDLSGGQWQKVALARAFFSQSPILVLDEPTSAMDARTEYQLFETFLRLTEGKTVFYITHRLSSVKQADKILLLKNGEVHAYDHHMNLMRENSYYRELYTMQSSLYFDNKD